MRRILVVGGAGYVGSVLTEELLQRGYAVRVLDRLYFGDAGLRAVRDRIELVEADMRAVSPRVLEGVDAVVNVGRSVERSDRRVQPAGQPRDQHPGDGRRSRGSARRRGCAATSWPPPARSTTAGSWTRAPTFCRTRPPRSRPAHPTPVSKYDAERASSPGRRGLLPRRPPEGHRSTATRPGCATTSWSTPSSGTPSSTRRLTLHHGGEMWRPLVDVRDAAQAYIALVEAERAAVRGEIFNLCYRNLRISRARPARAGGAPTPRDRRRASDPTTTTAACATTGSRATRSRAS